MLSVIPHLHSKKKLIDQLVYNLTENRNARFFTITVNQKEIVRKIVLTVIPKYLCYEVEQIFFLLAQFELHFVLISECFGMSLKS